MTPVFTLQWIAHRFTGAHSSIRSRQVIATGPGTSLEIFTQLDFGLVLLAAGVLL